MRHRIRKYTCEERQNYLSLNPDRADVIIPASEIYIPIMEWTKATYMLFHNVGLKDGIILDLYEVNGGYKV